MGKGGRLEECGIPEYEFPSSFGLVVGWYQWINSIYTVLGSIASKFYFEFLQ